MLRIYGASDDLIEVEGIESGEIGCWDQRVTFEIGTVEGGGYRVEMWHDGKTGWQTQIALLADKDDVVIPWPARFGLSECGYSVAVEIDCPEGTRVVASKGGRQVPID